MKFDMPKTKLGKWSVWLNVIFLIVIGTSVILVKVLKLLSFDDHWWDVTVLIFLASIAAFFIGLITVIKNKERSKIVFISIGLGLLVILFLIFHSLFISD